MLRGSVATCAGERYSLALKQLGSTGGTASYKYGRAEQRDKKGKGKRRALVG